MSARQAGLLGVLAVCFVGLLGLGSYLWLTLVHMPLWYVLAGDAVIIALMLIVSWPEWRRWRRSTEGGGR